MALMNPYDGGTEVNRTPVPAEFQARPAGASNAQLNFLESLIAERELTDDARTQLEARVTAQRAANVSADRAPSDDGITLKRASEFIERLQSLPKRQAQTVDTRVGGSGMDADLPEIPAGHYAIENADGELRFYQIDKPKNGRWAGRVFLSVQHGPDSTPIKGFNAKLTIIEKIVAAGAFECGVRYGREIGCCCLCGLRLTNRLSRELGIGPVCGGRFFEDDSKVWSKMKANARDAIRERGEDPKEEVA